MSRFIITGTSTDIGKTVFAAALARALDASYWKPIQSGLDSGTDSERVRLLGVRKILPEVYRLRQPLSPHRAAELDGCVIDAERLMPPEADGPLLVEGAGGVLVPVTRDLLFADLFARWDMPAILVARTGLGTINHSLLSIEALRARRIDIRGIAFVGEPHADDEETITAIGKVKRLGRLPLLEQLDANTLSAAFAAHFNIEDFL